MASTLIIGSEGQVGSELVAQLRNIFQPDQIVATDIIPEEASANHTGPYHTLDVKNIKSIKQIINQHNVKEIFNLAAVLSASAEKNPLSSWDLNINGLLNTLWLAKETGIKKIFWPSSIAVFGPNTPKENTPQNTVMDPNTVYGISKLAGERWCQYFFDAYGIDTRSIRYPGLISYLTEPGGGTTDYAVDIFHKALSSEKYTSFLKQGTYLPMLYMPDAIRGTIELMNAPASNLTIHSSYNLAGFSIAPETLAEGIKKYIPNFTIDYYPDFRQSIANTWPSSIDDSPARDEWGWKPQFSVEKMVKDMITNLKKKNQAN